MAATTPYALAAAAQSPPPQDDPGHAAESRESTPAQALDEEASADSTSAPDHAAAPASEDAPLDVVVYGAARAPVVGLRDPTVASYVLRSDVLGAPGLSSAEALARVPGVQVTRSGSASDLATAAVRGATSAQTPIYLAGIRLNDDLTGSVDLSTVPLWMLDRVEIYRGNAPDDCDVLGIGGAIRFEPRLPRRTEMGLGVGIGSFGAREAYAVMATGRRRSAALVAMRLSRARNDFEFEHDGGTALDPSDDRRVRRQNADASSVDLWSVGRLRPASLPGASVTVLLNGFAREAGAPGLQIIGARRARAEQSRVLAGVASRLPCSSKAKADGCQLELYSSGLLSAYRLLDPQRELGAASETTNHGRRLTHRLRLRVPATDWLELRFGAAQELSQLGVAVERQRSLRADRSLSRLQLGGRLELWTPLTVVVVSALECHSTSASGVEAGALEACGVLEPIGRVGARLRLAAPLALTANVGRYVRVPTLGELYGTSAVVRGNPELAPEQGATVDVGATLAAAGAALSGYAQVIGFVRFADELIGYRRSSFGIIRPYNIADARVLGLELAAGGGLWETVLGGVALTALDPRDVSADRQVTSDLLPFQSRLVVSPFLEIRAPRGWPIRSIDRASLVTRYRCRSSRVADPAGLIGLEEQGQIDVELSLGLLQETLRVRSRLENLLDQQNIDLVGYPLPGRSAHLTMEAWW